FLSQLRHRFSRLPLSPVHARGRDPPHPGLYASLGPAFGTRCLRVPGGGSEDLRAPPRNPVALLLSSPGSTHGARRMPCCRPHRVRSFPSPPMPPAPRRAGPGGGGGGGDG